MSETILKTVIASFVGVVSYLVGSFSQLIIVLIFLMLFDYVTGIMAAYFSGTLSTREGVKGVIKKMCFMIVIMMGFFLDFITSYLSGKVGLQISTNGMFGIAVICYLTSVEGISIVKNLDEIGVPIPQFLKSAFEKLKEQSEKAGGQDDK